MPQNVYDNDDFFLRYSHLERSMRGLVGAPEWPTLRALLPAMAGLRVLDLGCGYGWFSRWALAAGARSVVGIDLSEKMLARARAETTTGQVEYIRADLDEVELGAARFELAFSSLTLHYVKDLRALLGKIHRALSADGHFVFSAEHPILLAPSVQEWQPLGANSQPVWPLDRYLEEGPRTVDWLGHGVLKEHRTVATYLNTLLRAGFVLRRVEEWGPSAEQVREHPDWAVDRNRPYFLLVSAQRSDAAP